MRSRVKPLHLALEEIRTCAEEPRAVTGQDALQGVASESSTSTSRHK